MSAPFSYSERKILPSLWPGAAFVLSVHRECFARTASGSWVGGDKYRVFPMIRDVLGSPFM